MVTPPPTRHFCVYVYFLSIFVFADFSGLPMLWFPVHPLITIPASGALQPTNQLSARHHIFSAINSKFNWRKTWTCLFKICFMSIDRDQSTEGILVQTFKRPTLAKWQKKRKGSPVRGRWPMFTSILLVEEERDHDLFIKKREKVVWWETDWRKNQWGFPPLRFFVFSDELRFDNYVKS